MRGLVVLAAIVPVVLALTAYDATLLLYGPREWFYWLLVVGGPVVPLVLLALVSARVRRLSVGSGPKAALLAYLMVVVLVHEATQQALGVPSHELPPFSLMPPSTL
jgi:hypothetical protein